MEQGDWLRLLGDCWSDCDNISEHLWYLRGKFKRHRLPIEAMMTEEEVALYRSLPDEFPIYRGCDVDKVRGICWTLDRRVAERFPFLNKYHAPTPVLASAVVKKQDVVAVILAREESEIITLKPRVIKIEPLDRPRALPSQGLGLVAGSRLVH
jgi:hypothetical protein